MPELTISFTPASPAPASGYRVLYRPVGSSSYTQLTPDPTSSPVVIPDIPADTPYEGSIQSLCGSTNGNVIYFTAGALAGLEPFDYLVLRYYNDAGGVDLDTFTGFRETGTAFDIDYTANNNWVGYSSPINTTSPYLRWAGDNTSAGGVEAILVNFSQFIIDNPGIPDVFKIRLHCWWYNSIGTGDATIELQTWKDGAAPVQSGFDYEKLDGTSVDLISIPTEITCVRGSNPVYASCAQRVAELVYNKVTKTATLVSITGGCDCIDPDI